MAQVSRQNLMDFGGLYFKVRGLLNEGEETESVAPIAADLVAGDVDNDTKRAAEINATRAKLNELIQALVDNGVLEDA